MHYWYKAYIANIFSYAYLRKTNEPRVLGVELPVQENGRGFDLWADALHDICKIGYTKIRTKQNVNVGIKHTNKALYFIKSKVLFDMGCG